MCVRARARALARVCVSVRSRLQPCAFDLRPHASDQVELWCQLAGWGLVRVGMVPVPYDAHSRCTFPEISEAELHSAELRFAPSAPQHGRRSATHRQSGPPPTWGGNQRPEAPSRLLACTVALQAPGRSFGCPPLERNSSKKMTFFFVNIIFIPT